MLASASEYSRCVLPEPTDVTSSATSRAAAGKTAAYLVESVPQLDDSGANTADRYDWQAAMAAADGLALYHAALEDGQLQPDCNDRVLCEWQEDWICFSDAGVELVSAKHRDPSVGPYTTINNLANDGGLAHLFNRWAALNETVSCRLVTSGGLASGDPERLRDAADYFRRLESSNTQNINSHEHDKAVKALRKAIAKHDIDTRQRWDGDESTPSVPEPDRDAEVTRFLASLTIDCSQVQRDHVHHAAPSMFVQPVLDRIGTTTSPEPVWKAVLSLFQVRMKARGPIPTGELPAVLRHRSTPSDTPIELQRTLLKRTVTLTDIDTAIRAALAFPGAYRPTPRLPWTSRLEAKMGIEGCSENAIERAVQLRSEYREYWHERESGEATARVERKRLERLLHRVSDNATEPLRTQGQVLWRRLQGEVDNLGVDSLPDGMDPELALGGVCDLAQRCMIWFGPRFDVDQVLARERTSTEQE